MPAGSSPAIAQSFGPVAGVVVPFFDGGYTGSPPAEDVCIGGEDDGDAAADAEVLLDRQNWLFADADMLPAVAVA